ncbi:methyltransferase domain-containing protein [Ferruginibacter sp. HRS2-29]|uniref:methyltransferase domain-containing protein n=1 Tax=Ferruginibacter sp. HRS2-29 TaxID=2487334 RepID=UPI0020CF88F7|nr:methyltransferase domain-containing protein [Ferruginibacter sp. HRS2-29]MCP9749852.1 methyltransferase domain-containing protein [Ferruginibacter sp. HRS2-29]
MLDKNYWDTRYSQNDTGWDIGYVSGPIKRYVDGLTDKDLRVLIPGCGNAYEAEYLLQKGFTNVTLIDISPFPVAAVKEKLKDFVGKELDVICGDFFELDEKFDLILEQTFFCALDPSLRENYVNKMAELLNENGRLAGVLFNRDFEGGPPFGGTQGEYEPLFKDKFDIHKMAPCYNSIGPRAGTELFIELIKR